LSKKSRLKSQKQKPEKPVMSRGTARLPAWILLAVALLAILAVIRTVPFEFVYDDTQQVMRNPWIRSWYNLGHFFKTDVWAFTGSSIHSNYYRPLQMVAYTAAYSIAGLKPHAFHLLNILLHALCSVLVCLFGFRLTGNRLASAAGGLLFALHPIHAESVAWIAAVTDPLCAAFYFSALYFYLKDREEERNRGALILSLAFYAGALFSKEMAFTLPLAAAWLDWCRDRTLRWSRYAWFAGVFAVYSIMRVGALHAFSVQQSPVILDPGSRILSTIVLLGQYVAKMFVPHDISAFHVFVPTTSMGSGVFAFSLIVLAAYAVAAWLFRNQRNLLFLFGFGILTITPVLNVSGIGENVFADRYLYIPTLASCLLLPLLAQQMISSWKSRPAWLNLKVGIALLGVLLIASAWMLWNEIAVWQDTETLYLETMKRSPDAALIAHCLAGYYYERNELENAEKWDSRALEAWKRSFAKNREGLAEIYSGFGGLRFKQGRMDEARDYYLKAYNEAPRNFDILQNVGIFYVAMKDYKKALEFFHATVQLNPTRELAYSNIAGIYAMYGKWDLAIENARKAVELTPDYGDAWANLAYAYASKGMKEEARQAYLTLKRVDPSKSSMADDGLKSLGMR
jgi:protein O-mannosyl-transferase